MDCNDELKEINIKNCICYYFDDIIKIEGLDLNNILIDKIRTKISHFVNFVQKFNWF